MRSVVALERGKFQCGRRRAALLEGGVQGREGWGVVGFLFNDRGDGRSEVPGEVPNSGFGEVLFPELGTVLADR